MERKIIQSVSELLHLSLDETRIDKLEPTFTEWMQRAQRLDEKMSPLGINTPPAANHFE